MKFQVRITMVEDWGVKGDTPIEAENVEKAGIKFFENILLQSVKGFAFFEGHIIPIDKMIMVELLEVKETA